MEREDSVKKIMPLMLAMYVTATLMDSAFSIISPTLTETFGISASVVSMQVSICSVVFAICGAVYGTISDFIPIKKIILFAILMFTGGSVLGLVFQTNFYMFIFARAVQTIGEAAVSALYLVLTARYLKGSLKIKYFALFTACYQLSQAVGVLAGGVIATYVKWWMLFLVPLVLLFFIPALMKYLPKEEGQAKSHIDIAGLILLAVMVLSISMYFSNMKILWLGSAAVIIIVFAVYISKNKNAFVTIDFFKNRNYVSAVTMEFILYFVQIPFPFLYSFIIGDVYGKSLAAVSYVMLPAYIVAAVVGTLFTDKIIAKFGKFKVMTFAMTLILCALAATGIFMESGVVILSITSVLFSCGYVLMYSPVVDTVVSTLPKEQVGRGLGFNDMILNVSASIGIAVTGQLMVSRKMTGISIPFLHTANGSTYSAIMFVLAFIFLLGIIIFKMHRRNFEKLQCTEQKTENCEEVFN